MSIEHKLKKKKNEDDGDDGWLCRLYLYFSLYFLATSNRRFNHFIYTFSFFFIYTDNYTTFKEDINTVLFQFSAFRFFPRNVSSLAPFPSPQNELVYLKKPNSELTIILRSVSEFPE